MVNRRGLPPRFGGLGTGSECDERLLLGDVHAVGAGGGTGAAADAEALENVLQVVLHREKAAIEDVRDFRVGLPLGDPVQYLGLTRGQIQLLLEDLGGRCHLRMIFALWRTWLQWG